MGIHKGRIAALVLAASVVVAGCGGPASTGQGAGASGSATAGALPDAGTAPLPADFDPDATVTITYSGVPGGLDPDRVTGPGEWAYLYPVYDRLTLIDDNYDVRPMLAEKWAFAPDGKSLDLTIRQGATFQDGTPIDAAAVRTSLERARTLPTSTWRNSLKTVTAIDAPDARTVRLTLSGGGANLLALFSQPAGMVINPKAIADPNADLTRTTGPSAASGPYQATSITSGGTGKVTYTQRSDHPQYWDKAAGLIKNLTINNIPTSAQRINAARAGDSDISQITGVEVQQANGLVKGGQQPGILYPQTLTVQSLQFRSTRAPLNNPKIREAIAMAIDKKGIADSLYSGTCTVTNQPYASAHWAHSDAAEAAAPAYDLEKAKQLVAESGVPNPTFQLYFSPLYGPQTQVVQAQLAKIGITVQLTPTPTQVGGPSFDKGDFDAQWFPQTNSPDPSQMINDWYLGVTTLIPPADQARYTGIAEQAADVTKSKEQRAEILAPFWEQLAKDNYTVPICVASQVWLQSGKIDVDGMLYSWSGLNDFRYLYKRK
ncbi:MAG: ABC transporter substrate-binding protein [Pseudonocardia sp.]|nr:ABC transporter substrate-binding protein [Pseudonocardia sp.]